MHSADEKLAPGKGFRFTAKMILGLAILIASCTRLCFPQTAGQQTFPSAAAASQALFLATQSGNEQAVEHILGGGKELVSSGDEAQDNLDREQFAEKYQQMHRLERESDGTTQLYVGAENWPFPVPLVSRAKVWYFDAKAGTQEVRYRRLGENEYTAIETCHALVQANRQPEVSTTGVDPVTQYARMIINAHRTQIRSNASNWSHKPDSLLGASYETRRRSGAHAFRRSHKAIYETSSRMEIRSQAHSTGTTSEF